MIVSIRAIAPYIPAMLKRWHDWLKPGGKVCFCASTETSFFSHTIVAACRSQGIDLPNLHIPLGSIERCETLLKNAGFQNMAIQSVDLGKWMTMEEAQAMWNGRIWFHPNDPLPNQSEDTLTAIKAEYDRQIKTLEKPQGVWFENITYYVSGDR